MEILNITGSESTPAVKLNPVNHTLDFFGESRAEDSRVFYAPIFKWIEEYKEHLTNLGYSNSKVLINCTFKLSYYNSSSQKLIMDMLFVLTDIKSSLKNTDVIVNWHYHEDDEDTRDSGAEFEALTKLKFNLISYCD